MKFFPGWGNAWLHIIIFNLIYIWRFSIWMLFMCWGWIMQNIWILRYYMLYIICIIHHHKKVTKFEFHTSMWNCGTHSCLYIMIKSNQQQKIPYTYYRTTQLLYRNIRDVNSSTRQLFIWYADHQHFYQSLKSVRLYI